MMGIIYGGVPKELILELQRAFRIEVFVETGTFMGQSSLWAADHFAKVITIEAAQELFLKAKDNLKVKTNIQCLYGDSAHSLKQLSIDQPAIFWLDAHYSGGNTFKGSYPLLNEIETINNQFENSFILIDDARFVTSSWRNEQYCELVQLVRKLDEVKRYIAIFEDVVIAVPYEAMDVVNDYTNKMSEKYWNDYKQRLERKNELIQLKKIYARVLRYFSFRIY